MNRQEDRYRTSRVAYLSGTCVTLHEVIVGDVSKSGARVISESASLLTGENVLLDFGEGDVKQGALRWRSGGDIGISYNVGSTP